VRGTTTFPARVARSKASSPYPGDDPLRKANVIDCLNSGADDYLTQPIDVEVLAARLKALVCRTNRAKGIILKIDDLEIDLALQTVRRSGRTVDLSVAEFRILHYLIRRRSAIVSKHELMTQIYGDRLAHPLTQSKPICRTSARNCTLPTSKTLIATLRPKQEAIRPSPSIYGFYLFAKSIGISAHCDRSKRGREGDLLASRKRQSH
jgi:hypothetical protein